MKVNGGAIILRVKQCWHNEQMLGMVSRYLISMVDTYKPRTLQRGI